MELDWIEDFLVLTEAGVFSKAAARRNVTQPAFTRRIRKLEYALGAPLFDRSVHPVTLTPAGVEFRPMAVELLRTLSTARSRLRGLQGGEEVVSIAALQALTTAVLPGVLAAANRRRTIPPVKVLAEDFAGCVEALLTGTADILLSYTHPSIVTAEIDDGFSALSLGEDVMIAVSGLENGTPLFSLGDAEIPWLRYSEESFLGKVAARITARDALAGRLSLRYQNSMADGLRTAARAGLGVAWLPARAAREDLAQGRLLRISDTDTEEPIGIAMMRDRAPRSRPMERLWAELQRLAEDDRMI